MFYFQDDFDKKQKVLNKVSFGDTITITPLAEFSIPAQNEGQVFFLKNGDSIKWIKSYHKKDD